MNLASHQRAFRAALLAEATATAPSGFRIYHHAYRAQLIACLRETFPQLRKWLGDDEFTEAALAHIERAPPHSWTLDHYGAGFDKTLETLYPGDAEVGELAWLEWTLSCAFAGPDAEMIGAGSLPGVDWDNARLLFVPTLRQGEVSTNVAAIWSALLDDEPPPAVQLLPSSATVIVWRHHFSPRFRMIDENERRALKSMLEGATFGNLCDAIVGRLGQDEGVQLAGRLLGQWLQDGLITMIGQGSDNRRGKNR